ncbi:hypothetical protein E2C01_064756 [Portunus trituberculatus]|uniref:Uncharacterized protein n=1 Tax=Portunus trituberculatus TaxID=210409 RepID=A0A5B7HKN8_PORTR|nr:hypothetical protein [Portunus trituberculatus]
MLRSTTGAFYSSDDGGEGSGEVGGGGGGGGGGGSGALREFHGVMGGRGEALMATRRTLAGQQANGEAVVKG